MGLEVPEHLIGNWSYLEDAAEIARLRGDITGIANERRAQCGHPPLEQPIQDDLLYFLTRIVLECSLGHYPGLPTGAAEDFSPEELEAAVLQARQIAAQLESSTRQSLNRTYGTVVDMEVAATIEGHLVRSYAITQRDGLLQMARGNWSWDPRLDWTDLNWGLNMMAGVQLIAQKYPWHDGECTAPEGARDRLLATLAEAKRLSDIHAHPTDIESRITGAGQLDRLIRSSQPYIEGNWTPGILLAQSSADHLLAFFENYVTEKLPTLAEAEYILDQYAQGNWSLATESVITVEIEGLKNSKSGVGSAWEYRPQLALRFMVLPEVDWHFDEVVCTPAPPAQPA